MTHLSTQTSVAFYDHDNNDERKSDFLDDNGLKRFRSDTEQQSISGVNQLQSDRDSPKNIRKDRLEEYGCVDEIDNHNLEQDFADRIYTQALPERFPTFVNQTCLQTQVDMAGSNNEDDTTSLAKLLKTIDKGVSSLSDDNALIHEHLVRLQSNILEQQTQINQWKYSTDEIVPMMNAIQLNTKILQNEIEALKQKISDMPFQTSNDGNFVWKITNVAQKIADSIAEKQMSIYSPPFYSSPNGYKMCMRLYFNGDGQARRTHISLFFVILRGDYDAILPWPFSYKVTFSLYDQSGNGRHIIDSFRADEKSSSFQRPQSSMNVASGIPKFCSIPLIAHADSPYVRDDCMFIKCIVDFASKPKAIIPFMCNLNVGLPKQVQQQMIQTEMERIKAASTSNDS